MIRRQAARIIFIARIIRRFQNIPGDLHAKIHGVFATSGYPPKLTVNAGTCDTEKKTRSERVISGSVREAISPPLFLPPPSGSVPKAPCSTYRTRQPSSHTLKLGLHIREQCRHKTATRTQHVAQTQRRSCMRT